MHSKVLLASGLASLAAASNTCTVTSTTTLSGANPTGLAGCATVEGDVLIGTDVVQVTMADVKVITGALSAENAGGLSSIAAPQLTEIGGEFTLLNLTTLSTLSFPELTQVGSLHFEALPALSSLTFTKEIDTADTILITNTFLGTLDGINLQTVTDFNINNNGRLRNVSTQIESIKGALIIEANGAGLFVDFPNLEYASNFTVRNVAAVNIPSLSAINGSMGFYENDQLTTIFAPNLTTVGISGSSNDNGGLAIVDNPKLTNMTFPEFARSGGQVQLANNTLLTNVSFPKLSFVSGAIDFSGNFTTPNLPSITDVKGAFNVESQQSIDCSAFDSARGGPLQGKYTCKTTNDTKSLSNGGGSDSSSSTSTKPKKNAGTQVTFSQVVISLSLVGAFFSMLV